MSRVWDIGIQRTKEEGVPKRRKQGEGFTVSIVGTELLTLGPGLILNKFYSITTQIGVLQFTGMA